jgi:O-methyltransferase
MVPPIRERFKRSLRYHLCPYVFRYPRLGLTVPRFYRYLRALHDTQHLTGAVVEVGAAYLGTTALAYRFLCDTRPSDLPARRYLAVDTFAGFVEEQFAADQVAGVARSLRHAFTSNSLQIARRLRSQYGIEPVELLQGDIVALPADALPAQISVALIDVDLEIPVAAALEKLWPRLQPGGFVLVDDCDADGRYPGAQRAFAGFVAERGLVATQDYGLGVLASPP